MTRYYTYRKQVPLKHGQHAKFRKGHGWYVVGKPTVVKKPAAKKKPAVFAHMVSEKGLEFIARWEGCVLHAYDDGTGVWTIGIGHTGGVKPGQTITRARALALLRQDAGHAVAAVNSLGLHLTQPEFDALVSFAFNCGGGALTGGVSKNLHAGSPQAAMVVLREYDHAAGRVLTGLVRRRAAESALFLHGSYGA